MNEKYTWMSHLEWVVLIMSLVGGLYTITSRIDATNNRVDQMLIVMHQESKDFHNKFDQSRSESNQILEGIRQEMREFQVAMKDFHGRLCAIEERNKAK